MGATGGVAGGTAKAIWPLPLWCCLRLGALEHQRRFPVQGQGPCLVDRGRGLSRIVNNCLWRSFLLKRCRGSLHVGVKGMSLTSNFLHLVFREDFNIAVLHAFVDLHEFTDLNLVQALR